MRQLGARPETRSVRPAASYWSIVRLSLAALPGAGAFSVSILALGGHRTNDHTIGWKPANVRAEDHRCDVDCVRIFESVVAAVGKLHTAAEVSRSGAIVELS